jgi:nitrate/nitrite transporter NarK
VGGPDGDNFSIMGHHITHSPRTAVAITGTIQNICAFVLTAPGGWVADRFSSQRALLLMGSALIQTVCPLINAFLPVSIHHKQNPVTLIDCLAQQILANRYMTCT